MHMALTTLPCAAALASDCLARPRWQVICGSFRKCQAVPTPPTPSVPVTPVSSVRNLATFIKCNLVMRTHVQRTVWRCFAALCQLRQVCCSLPTAAFQSLVVALVYSQLDYGNSALLDTPVCLVCPALEQSTLPSNV
jgi:hypothetical protein